jgi:hypothetical protein
MNIQSNSSKQSNKSNKSNKSNSDYKFAETTDKKLILKMNKLSSELKIKQQKESNIKVSDVSAPGGIFDSKAFNEKVNSVMKIARQRRKLKDRIKLAKLTYRPLDYNKLTIAELKMALYNDTYDMFDEFSKLKEFNLNIFYQIISKNYRKLTILILFLVLFILTYVLINILV